MLLLLRNNILVALFCILCLHHLRQCVSECLSRCSCQLLEEPRTIDCSDSLLMAFPDKTDSTVQRLILSDNSIAVIPNMENFYELTYLSLSRNKIQSISSTAFQKLLTLRYLDISYNFISDLSQINANTFIKENHNLISLNLSGNQITNLGTDIPYLKSNLFSLSLEILDLSHCRINSISDTVLLELPKLKYLDLSSNPVKWMRNLQSESLIHLDLSNGQLDYISRTELKQLPLLRNLSVSGNSELDISNLMSVKLSRFEAARCSLTIPGLKNMPYLQYANLRENKITTLPRNSFTNNTYIKELDLSKNLINIIDVNTFVGLEYLEKLNLAVNSISGNLPSNLFTQNRYLKHLNLSNNQITSFHELRNPSIKFLDLSSCKIKDIYKDSLTYLPSLIDLKLSYNPLEQLPDDISSTSLKNFDISYCRLSTIQNGTFRGLTQLTSINLEGNRFTEPMKVYVLEHLLQLQSIWLGNNPWSCDCDSLNFKDLWFHLNDARKIMKSDAKCQLPESLRGISWKSACSLQWYPDPEANRSIFDHYGVIVLISVFSVATLLFVILTIRRKIVSLKKRQDQHEMENHLQSLDRLRRSRESVNSHRETEIMITVRDSPRETRPRQASQPPSYYEAVLLPRLRASREELESAGRVSDSQEQQVNVEAHAFVDRRRRNSNISSSSVDTVSPSNSHSDTDHNSESDEEYSEENTHSEHRAENNVK